MEEKINFYFVEIFYLDVAHPNWGHNWCCNGEALNSNGINISFMKLAAWSIELGRCIRNTMHSNGKKFQHYFKPKNILNVVFFSFAEVSAHWNFIRKQLKSMKYYSNLNYLNWGLRRELIVCQLLFGSGWGFAECIRKLEPWQQLRVSSLWNLN